MRSLTYRVCEEKKPLKNSHDYKKVVFLISPQNPKIIFKSVNIIKKVHALQPH
jgi:hypothetical protein